MDLCFLTGSVFGSQEALARGSLPHSPRVGGLPGRDCIETGTGAFLPPTPPPFFLC